MDCFDRAMSLFDAANAQDPHRDRGPDGGEVPRDLLYAQRMTVSPAAREFALASRIKLPEALAPLIVKAVSGN